MIRQLRAIFQWDVMDDFDSVLHVPHPVYVIGDIHGRMDLLKRMRQLLDHDAGQRGILDQMQMIYIGDYVDRGDNSAHVLIDLWEKNRTAPEKHICLKGNHEAMMLEFLDTPAQRGARWLRNGGLQTLASFDVGGVSETSQPQELEKARDELRRKLPDGMEMWLQTLPSLWQSGNLIAVHASLAPHDDPHDQDENTRIWGHRDFFKLPRDDGNWVVHGHTIVDHAKIEMGRISIDTGAYATGRLSAAGFHSDLSWFLST